MSKGSPHLCKPCRNLTTQEWAAAHPSEWENHKRKSMLKRKYGITPEDFDAMLAAQGGVCAVCGTSGIDSRGFRPHIDHCHRSGRVRGILCGPCNRGLGSFRDSPEVLRGALAYLLSHEEAQCER